jgi:hypothetical protein
MIEKAFNDLSLEHKELLIEDIGIQLISIEYYDFRIHLYAMNTLFVEAYYDIETRKLESIISISFADLDKYLSRILIHDLVNFPRRSSSSFFL